MYKTCIMKTFLVILFCLTTIQLFSQVIHLNQKKSAADISVSNGDYTLYFKQKDVLDAIKEISKIQKVDDQLVKDISENRLSAIDMKSNNAGDKKIIDLLRSNLVTYLIINKKVSVYKEDKIINALVADSSPPMVELDGKTWFKVFFSPEKSDGQVFLGDIDKRLSKNLF